MLYPPETPYVWSPGPVTFFGDSGDSYLLSETRIYNDADQWVGISFTASEPGFYRGSLAFQWRLFVSIMACSAVLPPGRTEPAPAGAFPRQL